MSNNWLVQLSALLETEQVSYFASCLFKYKWMQLKWVLVVKYSKEREAWIGLSMPLSQFKNQQLNDSDNEKETLALI